MKRFIFTSLSPNAQWDDAILGLRLALPHPHSNDHTQEELLRERLQKYFDTPHVFLFESGRSAIASLLRAVPLQPGDEVLLQAFTCVAVPNAVRWAGGTPRYVDCKADTYTMSPDDLRKKITARSRVLIIQHTFGIPADLDELLAIARQHNLVVIEDCAHAIGSMYRGKRVGSYGHAAMVSFGRDKVVSSVFGGAAFIRDADLATRLNDIHKKFLYPRSGWVLRQFLHPFFTYVVKKSYSIGVGKILLTILRASRILFPAVTKQERYGQQPAFAFHAMPPKLAALANHQWEKLEVMNTHRKMIAAIYREVFAQIPNIELPLEFSERETVFLRYPIRVNDPRAVLSYCRARGIYLGDWYDTAVAPRDVDIAEVGYISGSCPIAEELAQHVINLPTSITCSPDDARKVAECVKKALSR